jgi:hypothetical protein
VIDREERARRRRRKQLLRWGTRLLVAAAVFALGIAVREALHDNPRPGGTQTIVTTFKP